MKSSTSTANGFPDANYGNVWVPRVVPTGWAPYRYGSMALGAAVGLDLGRPGTVGLCAVSLRALGHDRQSLVLDGPAGVLRVRCGRRRWSASSAAAMSAYQLDLVGR